MARKRDKKRSRKRDNSSVKTYSLKQLNEAIYNLFATNPTRSFNYKQAASKLEIRDNRNKRYIMDQLIQLHEEDVLIEEARGKYRLKALQEYVEGRFMMRGRDNMVICEDIDEPIYIAKRSDINILPEDIVKVLIYAKREGHSLQGEIIDLVKRGKDIYVGTVSISRDYAFVVPTQRIGCDLFIPPRALKGAKDGQKVTARITDWPRRAKNPYGEIVTVLGNSGEHFAEMHAIIEEFNLPKKFPKLVDNESEKLDLSITEEEIAKRRDFRSTPTFTIDPKDAKDFDDALSIEHLSNGNIEVGVHIADVTHYVTEGSKLEEEAYERATSVYLVDRVIPMLPERLSNGACSLRPNEDKLCFSAVFELDSEGVIHNEWFGRSVIYSDKRFTYEEAQEIIEGSEGPLKSEILTLDTIAKKLRAQRFEKGAIDFDRYEVKFNLDEKGTPLNVFFKESKDANKLIEEFMLLANRQVASFVGERGATYKNRGNAVGENSTDDESNGDSTKGKTFIYRIHNSPDQTRLNDFNKFLKKFDLGIKTTTPIAIATSMNKMLAKVHGRAEQNIIETLAIRTMAKAAYSTDNIGHYGLGFSFYSHFTSPIRRYPDMMVHRLLARYLDGAKSEDTRAWEERCKHSSAMETRATQAERASIKYKQAEFMKDQVGEHFEGVISGVTEWGMYVELDENKCEGMVPLREMKNDHYIFDAKNYQVIGKRYGDIFQLGDSVTVEVLRVNLEKKQLDFIII